MFQDVFWTPAEGIGFEHLRFLQDKVGVAAESVVIGTRDTDPFRIYYELECNYRWQLTRVHVRTLGQTSQSVTLRADGSGTWIDSHGEIVTELQGAIDVDISATAFTNTLPMRRLELDQGESTEIMVAYISVPNLCAEANVQRYTCLEPFDDNGGRYQYDAVDSDFTAKVVVDKDGLVTEYPGLFTRIEPT